MKSLMLKKILGERKPLNQLTQEEYQKLIASGKLWNLYPTATGDPREDLDCFVTISKLAARLNEMYGLWYKNPNHTDGKYKEIQEYYNDNFINALKNEVLNEETAQIVASMCYDHGHSAGYSEVVNYAFEFVDIAKRIIEANKK